MIAESLREMVKSTKRSPHAHAVSDNNEVVTVPLLINSCKYTKGIVKCRLVHMKDRSFVQPDMLLCIDYRKYLFIPKFFYANQIAFFENGENNFCRFQIVTEDDVVLTVGFFARDKIRTLKDGSILYRCYFSRAPGIPAPKSNGTWREHDGTHQLKLFHHTTDTGFSGITRSGEIWGSRRNIQGNLWLNNMAYGYFTSIDRIRTEADLNAIAMSSSGLTGLVPTNAPWHPMYAHLVQIPRETIFDRTRTLCFWVDCVWLAPNHLWLHRPMTSPAYYEVVLPKIFRIGLRVGANLRIKGDQIHMADGDHRFFEYVIVGDADSKAGLEAPFHEEETASIAMVEPLSANQEIIECWKRKANTHQLDERIIEYADLQSK